MPLLVTRFMSRGSGFSEPAMTVLVPIEQYKARYSFVAPGVDGANGYSSYVQVVIESSALSSLRLDGQSMANMPLRVVGGSNPSTIAGTQVISIIGIN